MTMKPLALFSVVFLVGFVVPGCAAAPPGNCDPHTIAVNGECYWEKAQACDAATCPLDKCIVHESAPATVECRK